MASNGLTKAVQMLERIQATATEGPVPDKLPALMFTVQLAAAHALVGLGQELAAVHDQLIDLEATIREASGMEPRS